MHVNKRNILSYLIFPLLFILISIVYYSFFLAVEGLSLFPNSDLSTSSFSDADRGDHSKICSFTASDQQLELVYQIEKKEGAYAGFDVHTNPSIKDKIALYNAIDLTYSTHNISAFTIGSRTFEEGVTDPTEELSYRFNYFFLDGNSDEVVQTRSVCFSDFKTKSWWVKRWMKAVELNKDPDWSNTAMFSFTHEIAYNPSEKCVLKVFSLKLTRDNSLFFLGFSIVLLSYFLGIVAFRFRKKYRNKKNEVVITYKSTEFHGEKGANWQDEVIQFIGNEYSTADLTVSDVAAQVGQTERGVSKFIQSKLQLSFKQYLNRIRLEEAKKLLRTPELSVKEIAYSVGYSSTNHFSRVFKKYEAITPTEFRDQIQNN